MRNDRTEGIPFPCVACVGVRVSDELQKSQRFLFATNVFTREKTGRSGVRYPGLSMWLEPGSPQGARRGSRADSSAPVDGNAERVPGLERRCPGGGDGDAFARLRVRGRARTDPSASVVHSSFVRPKRAMSRLHSRSASSMESVTRVMADDGRPAAERCAGAGGAACPYSVRTVRVGFEDADSFDQRVESRCVGADDSSVAHGVVIRL